jgi:hypothetical protein
MKSMCGSNYKAYSLTSQLGVVVIRIRTAPISFLNPLYLSFSSLMVGFAKKVDDLCNTI